jgi:mRNA-degrading endonuclease RelE of RelBE toxin-antitoxin system
MRISASEQVQLWLAGLPPQTKRRVRSALKSLVASARDLDVKALRWELEGCYRLRVGDQRIVYHLETKQIIRLDYVDLREEVYEAFRRLRALREPREPQEPRVPGSSTPPRSRTRRKRS